MNFPRRRRQEPQMTETTPFDVNNLEAEITELVHHNRVTSLLPAINEFAPKPNIESIGRLTAAAVNEQHEQAAEAISQLGETIKDLTRQHELALAELDATARLIKETAEKYIALGLEKSDLIAKSAAVMADVKQTCADVMEKIRIPSVS